MASRVGTKGQVVIAKEIRDALHVVPGSVAVQRMVGNAVEIRFLAPEHERSLRGVLAEYVTASVDEDAEHEAEESAWAEEAARRDREVGHGQR